MPNYLTEDGYTSITETRTRVGRNLPAAQHLLLVDLLEGKFETVDYAALPGIDDDPLEELRESAVDWHVERGAEREEVEKAVEAPETRPLTAIPVAMPVTARPRLPPPGLRQRRGRGTRPPGGGSRGAVRTSAGAVNIAQ